eukprot:jgi/Undpi1/2941/HiC_scaffold_14.g06318.m1
MMDALLNTEAEGMEIAQDRQELPLPPEQTEDPKTVESALWGVKDVAILEEVAYFSDEISPGMMNALRNENADAEGAGGAQEGEARGGGKPVSPDANNEVFREAEDVLSKKKAASELHPTPRPPQQSA